MTESTQQKTIETGQLITEMTAGLKTLLDNQAITEPVMIGIHSGGAWLAKQLHHNLAINAPLGNLDISFYRDDFTRLGINPQVQPSSLPFSIDDQHIILVDDVLFTGRTIRAALNEIFDYGRPASVILCVLVDRGERELPIHADITGMDIKLDKGQQIKLSDETTLMLEIINTAGQAHE